MDKKFLSAEEAVAHFGLDPEQFQSLVDEGKLRALADRGTFKFRRDEIESLIQEGLLSASAPAGNENAGPQTLEFESSEPQIIVEDLNFLELDEEALSEGATMIKKSSDRDLSDATTPSDVRAVPDEPATRAAAAPAEMKDSDSEVTLVREDKPAAGPVISSTLSPSEMPVASSLSEFELVISSDSSTAQDDSSLTNESSVIVGVDEDIGLPESDSDVKVLGESAVAESAADADATDHVIPTGDSVISPASSSLSGVQPSDSDVKIMDSGISLERGESGFPLDSGLTLESSVVLADHSGIKKDDSGITLEPADSGFTLEPSESGISLEDDSGMTLEMAADSGLTLDHGDSGIALEGTADSGIRLDGADSGLTLDGPESGIAVSGKGRRASRPDDTQAELPGDDFESADDQTTLIAFDEDEDALETLPPTKGKKAKRPSLSETFDSVDEVEDLEIAEDLDAGELDVEAVDADDEDFAEDVLDASDEAFSTSEEGESVETSAASVPAMKAVKREPSWGVAAMLPIAACAFLLLAQAAILWTGVATMWTGEDATAIGKPLVDALGGIF